MTKVKNKTYQPLPLIVNEKTVLLPARKSLIITTVTPQMIALKSKGLLQIIKK